MGQALKVIKFESEENQEVTEDGKKRSFKNQLSVIFPVRIAAISAAVIGIISLVFEVHIYFQFRYEIYLVSLIPTLFSLLTLILLQTKFGFNNQKYISHSFLFILLASVSFVSYKLPVLFGFNLIGASLFVLLLSLFLNWGYKNQLLTAVFFTLSFSMPLVILGGQIAQNENLLLLIPTVIFILIISVIASGFRHGEVAFTSNKNIDPDYSETDQILGDQFIANSLVPLFKCNIKGEFEFINLSFREILNLAEDFDISKLNLFDDVIKNDKVKDHFLKKMENKGKVEGYRFKYEDRNGDEEVFLMDCKSTLDNENIFIEGSLRNITKQYKSEKALRSEIDNLQQTKRQNNKTIPSLSITESKKSNVISKMGHELRTPMNSVLGFLTLIENGLFQNEQELKEFSHSAKLSAESLLGLISDVVEISKIQNETVEVDSSEFNLREDIEQLKTDLKPHLDQKELELSIHFDESIPEVIVSDRFKYKQILTNLLRNAIQITEEGNINLYINAQEEGEGQLKLITSIEDASEGFEEDKLQELISGDLENKEKVSRITSNILHLMISRELVNLLDGRIKATSEIGQGNTFSFEIDIRTAEVINEDQISDTDKPKKNRSFKAKLLLVEDNPISRKVEQKLLHEAGYDVVCVDNANEAIDLINNDSFDLILMDIELKDMDGLEATKQIRELPNERNQIPIIAVTAHSSMKDREKCLIAGMNDYISKPINITFLKMTIDQWLNEAKSN